MDMEKLKKMQQSVRIGELIVFANASRASAALRKVELEELY